MFCLFFVKGGSILSNLDFIEKVAPIIKKYAKEFGFGVPSAVIAQACLESAYGTSGKAKRHNYFGLKYRENRISCNSGTFIDGSSEEVAGKYVPITAQWYAFASVEDGIRGYFEFVKNGPYAAAREISQNDYHGYLTALKKCGYATSSAYVANNEAVIRKWELTVYDSYANEKEVTNMTMPAINTSKPCSSANRYAAGTNHPEYIVLHYTANKTDTAKANANYFQNNSVGASAHYFVDPDSIYQSVPDNAGAWHVGRNFGSKNLYGICHNKNSIGIEMCSQNSVITEQTVQNAIALTKYLMNKYGINADHVVRHYDVCSKNCPGWKGWNPATGDNSKWEDFKARLSEDITLTSVELPKICPIGKITAKVDVNVRQWPDLQSHVWEILAAGEAMEVLSVWNGTHAKVQTEKGYEGYVALSCCDLKYYYVLTNPRKAKVVCPGDVLNVRAYRSTDYPILGTLEDGQQVTYYDGRKDAEGALWVLIAYKGGYGFVSGDYINM